MVQGNFIKDFNLLIVEKISAMNGGPKDIYGCTSTLIEKESPFLYISNFSQKPITITAGQAISQGQDPAVWLDKESQFTKSKQDNINVHANVL